MTPTCDLYDEFGNALEFMPPELVSFGAKKQFFGPVETVKCFEDNSRIRELSQTPGNGRVLIVDAAASRRRAVMGDVIAGNFVENGWAGVIIWGAIRDVVAMGKLDMGVLALGTIPCPGKRRDDGQIGIEILVGEARISSGAFVVADEDGAVVFTKDGPRPSWA